MDSNNSAAVWRDYQSMLARCHAKYNQVIAAAAHPSLSPSLWRPLFDEALEQFSKVWQYQLDCRPALTKHGLKRLDIGDLAGKIAQLYQLAYSKTSEVAFLRESYVFYEAIRSRQYFSDAPNAPATSSKQLRYCARFIMVCLLLGKREEVWQLLQELQALQSSYSMAFRLPDAQEWRLMADEITSFMQVRERDDDVTADGHGDHRHGLSERVVVVQLHQGREEWARLQRQRLVAWLRPGNAITARWMMPST